MNNHIVKEGFITKATSDYLNNYLRTISTVTERGFINCLGISGGIENWDCTSGRPDTAVRGYELEDNDRVYDILGLIIKSIANEFGFEKNRVRLKRMLYQAMVEGQEIGSHTDDAGAYNDNLMDHDGYSALLYLTDDYVGGEIEFYDEAHWENGKQLSYHPKAGTLIHFKGDHYSPHAVKLVESGERCNLIFFYDIRKD